MHSWWTSGQMEAFYAAAAVRIFCSRRIIALVKRRLINVRIHGKR